MDKAESTEKSNTGENIFANIEGGTSQGMFNCLWQAITGVINQLLIFVTHATTLKFVI